MEELVYRTEGKNQYDIFWEHHLNGGGMFFGSEYPGIIQQLYPDRIFKNCLEWCAGPGFIGYNLLDHGLCEKIVFNDIYQPALDISYRSAQFNNLLNKVDFYCTGFIDQLPKSCKFDLVVGNPPHYDRPYINNNSRIADDTNWEIHRQFYNNIGNYLTDDAIILLQENEDGSKPEYFADMIIQSNLKLNRVIKSPNHYTINPTMIYYIEVTK